LRTRREGREALPGPLAATAKEKRTLSTFLKGDAKVGYYEGEE
jgi:hypothetical protein